MNGAKFKAFSSNSEKASATGKVYDLEVIRQDVLNMVHTRKGEYPMDLDRGFIIHDYLFSPTLNGTEENIIIEDAKKQLSEDPRFNITEVRVFTDDINQYIVLYLDLFVKPFDENIILEITFKE